MGKEIRTPAIEIALFLAGVFYGYHVKQYLFNVIA
jgi:hypothetical protein